MIGSRPLPRERSQWLAFTAAYLLQTEKFFDLTGSITYISVTIIAVLLNPVVDGRSILLLVLVMIWAFGFAIEATADAQKNRFRADPENKGKFIHTGLWARSRHPNYFGEIVIWIGVAVIALPILRGWQWVSLISPVFVTLLITRISGVPMLEKRADEKWGGQEDYEAYKERTPVLIPRP
jgi:steroid 5-alpha reductase family enzyme